jgi:hypothetical protein
MIAIPLRFMAAIELVFCLHNKGFFRNHLRGQLVFFTTTLHEEIG